MVLAALTVSALGFAGDNRLNFVPWKVLEAGVEPAKKAFLLFWIPASSDEVPLAILVEGDKEVARVANQSGFLSAASVEAMVRKAFDTREVALNTMLDQASKKAASGEKAEAIGLYRQVAAQGCAFPRLARAAQRALRRLGVKE